MQDNLLHHQFPSLRPPSCACEYCKVTERGSGASKAAALRKDESGRSTKRGREWERVEEREREREREREKMIDRFGERERERVEK